MDTFTKLFGSLVCFVYHCFDRIVILGYLPLLTRAVRWPTVCSTTHRTRSSSRQPGSRLPIAEPTNPFSRSSS
jgi:hypothetical protein